MEGGRGGAERKGKERKRGRGGERDRIRRWMNGWIKRVEGIF